MVLGPDLSVARHYRRGPPGPRRHRAVGDRRTGTGRAARHPSWPRPRYQRHDHRRRAVIPRARSFRRTGTGTVLSDGMVVAADGPSRQVGALLAAELGAATGWQVHTGGPGAESGSGVVRLRVGPATPAGTGASGGATPVPGPNMVFPAPGNESYRLRVGPDGIDIEAPSAAGAFYGTRTLRQLLPPELLRSAPASAIGAVAVEGAEIEDAPRFGWRGMGLDVSRHFFPKAFILKLVDLASLHKLNVLHLHLTDDQGWRVQVDRYPRLTEVGRVAAGVPRRPLPGRAYGQHPARRFLHQSRPGRNSRLRRPSFRNRAPRDRHAGPHASGDRVLPRARQHRPPARCLHQLGDKRARAEPPGTDGPLLRRCTGRDHGRLPRPLRAHRRRRVPHDGVGSQP